MTCSTPAGVQAALGYIESHLEQKLTLEAIAAAVHYSPYHLHRSLAACTGQTLYSYAVRRQITQAAKYLIVTEAPILDIALGCGYASQQSFSTAFKALYKLPPAQYRYQQVYYPLQLPFALQPQTACRSFRREDIRPAVQADIPAWLALVDSVVDGYPYLDEADYRRQLARSISDKRALILTDGALAIGAMIFAPDIGSIEFFGVHPQYRRRGLARLFLEKLCREYLPDRAINTTTFRARDRADTGYRQLWQQLGFTADELLVEWGYPTQRFVLPKGVIR